MIEEENTINGDVDDVYYYFEERTDFYELI